MHARKFNVCEMRFFGCFVLEGDVRNVLRELRLSASDPTFVAILRERNRVGGGAANLASAAPDCVMSLETRRSF